MFEDLINKQQGVRLVQPPLATLFEMGVKAAFAEHVSDIEKAIARQTPVPDRICASSWFTSIIHQSYELVLELMLDDGETAGSCTVVLNGCRSVRLLFSTSWPVDGESPLPRDLDGRARGIWKCFLSPAPITQRSPTATPRRLRR